MQSATLTLDFLATAFVFGTTVWFFFIQAPVLLNKFGREKFVPIQMMLTRVLAPTLLVGTLVMLGAAVASSADFSAPVITAAIAVLGAFVNAQFLIPRALRAGGRGHREIRGKDADASTVGFAADGVGEVTATLHRLVVLCVVVMLAGVVPHALLLAGVL
ncbi:MAG: hypothetical protein ACI9OJ_003644 [Myxococcota bacterium]|jgi:hypothetical protein